MAVLFANNASSTLQGSINTAVTSIVVDAADASKFPTPTGSDWFPVTLTDSGGNMEIMRCTARVGAALTVARAQEGTTAKAFAAGSIVSHRLTAAAVNQIYNDSRDADNLSSGTLPAARLSGEYSFSRLRLTSGSDASPTSTNHAFQVGPTDGLNVIIDDNEIMCRDNGVGRYIFIEFGVNVGVASVLTANFVPYWHPDNDGPGTGLDADTVDGIQGAALVQTSRTITAGNGLTGGGSLAANRTVALGTPSDITNDTDNDVGSTTHTHKLGFIAAEVNTSSSAAATSFKVGHTIVVFTDGTINRNASVTPCIFNTNSQEYVADGVSGAGAELPGTWRGRGFLGNGRYLVEKTAD